jgi:uncharacterized protein YndB with AHSA1/START domain
MSETRSTEVAVEIAATRDEVWRALTEAEELVRWFPLGASVRPGAGGEMAWQWEGRWTWISEIERWEPGVALTLVNRDQRPFDVAGGVVPEDRAAPATLKMEFTLETADGRTSLRLVHSGFGRGALWDDEYDGVSVGWQYELRSLKFYLERHRGRRRRAGLATVSTGLSQAEAWGRLASAEGYRFDHWPLRIGERYSVKAAFGDRFSGEVYWLIPERDLSGTVVELGDGLFRLGTHRAGGKTGISVWIASYAADPGHIEELRGRSQRLLERLFPS